MLVGKFISQLDNRAVKVRVIAEGKLQFSHHGGRKFTGRGRKLAGLSDEQEELRKKTKSLEDKLKELVVRSMIILGLLFLLLLVTLRQFQLTTVVIGSVVFALVITAFRVAPLWQSLLAVGPALLVGLGMAAVTTAFTARLDDEAGLPLYFRLVVIPMFLFSGAFFPITQLPGWLQGVALATPMYHGVELSRAIVVGTEPPVAWWISVLYLLAWIVAGTALSLGPFRKRLTP